MNHVFRVIWNRTLGVWQVASELTAAHGKSKSLKRTAGMALAIGVAPAVWAGDLPVGGQVVAGHAAVAQSGANMVIQQTSDKLAIDWQSFSVGEGHRVQFVQPSARSAALNRVLGSDVSLIRGSIEANGRVFLVNPNGVVFSPTSQVDVGALVVSTLNISTEDFMAGRFQFEGDSTAAIEAHGHVRAADGGAVALIAARIIHTGDIDAAQGQVLLGAGRKVLLDLGGPASIEVQEGTLEVLIEQGGAIRAAGGQVLLSARAARDLVSSVINHDGLIDVTSLDAEGGMVALEADAVHLGAQSMLDARGAMAGGTVHVGGEWQGRGQMRQAKTLTMAAGAVIDASAIQTGQGGQVVLWSDVSQEGGTTQVHGQIHARGGAQAGNGGQVETSGHGLDVEGIAVDTSAAQGAAGDWLLDPYNIVIDASGTHASSATASGTTTVTSNGTTTTVSSVTSSYISHTTIESALANNNVTVQTSVGPAGEGDITIASDGAITYTGSTARTLTLKADRHVKLNAGGNITSTNAPLNVHFWADSDKSGDGINQVTATTVSTNGGWLKFGNNDSASIGGNTVLVGGDVYFNGASAQTLSTGGGQFDLFGETLIGNPNGVTVDSAGGAVNFHGIVNSANQYSFVDKTAAAGTGSWDQAWAEAKSGAGTAVGNTYLVTITSRLENAVAGIAAGYRGSWIGAQRDLNAADWRWKGGPENTVNFFDELSTSGGGTAVNGAYNNFGLGEPNGYTNGTGGTTAETYATDETAGQFFGTAGQWNDLKTGTTYSASSSTDQYAVLGFVKETNLANSPLTIEAGTGLVTIDGSVGANKALASLTVTSPTTQVNGQWLKTSGLQSYSNDLNVNASSSKPAFTISAGNTATAGGDIAIYGNGITLDANLAALTDITLDGVVTLARDVTLTSGSTQSFAYSSSVQTFVVPAGVTSLTASLVGGAGGNGGSDGDNRGGVAAGVGSVTASFDVNAGDTLYVAVGSGGSAGSNSVGNTGGGAGGSNAFGVALGGRGGNTGDLGYSGGGGGGGAGTVLSLVANPTDTSDLLIAAGGGGAGGSGNNTTTQTNGTGDAQTAASYTTGLNGQVGYNSTNGNAGGRTVDGGGSGGGGGGVLGGQSNLTVFNTNEWTGRGGNAGLSGATTGFATTSLSTAIVAPSASSAAGSASISYGGGNIHVTGTINGAHSLNVNSPNGTVALDGAVGGNSVLTQLQVTGARGISLGGGAFTTSGSQKYTGPVTLDANLTTMTTTNSAVTLAGDVLKGSGVSSDLTITAGTGAVSLNGKTGTDALAVGQVSITTTGLTSVGGEVNAASFDKLGAGATSINAALVMTATGQSYGGAVTLGDEVTLSNSGAGDITVSGAFSNATTHDLEVINLGGDISLLGDFAIGTNDRPSPIGAVSLDASGAVKLGTSAAPTRAALASLSIDADTVTVYANTTGFSYDGVARFGIFATAPMSISVDTSGTVNGILSGATTLTKGGAGTLTMTGDNRYTGATTIAAGTLVVQDDTPTSMSSGFAGPGALVIEPSGTGFTNAFNLSLSYFPLGSDLSGLTIGKAGNNQALTIGRATSIAGPIALYGSSMAIDGALSATGGNDVSLTATDNVTQTQALSAAGLLLQGSGAFTLSNAGNTVSTLAANTGAVTYYNAGALSIDRVGGVSGVSATGAIDIETLVGDLTVLTDVSTSNATASAVVLNAGRSAAAGTAAGGDLLLGGEVAITAGTNGRIRLYTGSKDNTALHDWAALVNATEIGKADETTSVSPTTGFFGIYRDTLTIPLFLRLVAGSGSVYGDTPVLTYALYDASTGGSVVTDASPSGSVTWSGTMPTATSNVGSYALTYGSGISLGNTDYALNAGGAVNWVVNARPITLTAADASRVYGSANPTLSGFSVVDRDGGAALPNGDTIASVTNTVATTATTGASAGSSHAITPSAAVFGSGSAGNYSITYVPGSLSIDKRAITLVANNAGKTYGNVDQALSVRVANTAADEGLASVDRLSDVTGTLSRQAGEDVGAYDLLLGTGAKASNYTITFNADNNALTVLPRAITLALSANAASKTYGEADPTLALDVGGLGLASGDALADVTGTLTRQAGEDVGSYRVSLGVAPKASNYDISFSAADGSMVITPRDISLQATTATKVYGNADPAFAVTVSNTAASEGIANGDALADVVGTLTRQAGEDVGAYDLVLGSGAKAGNYNISFDADNNALSITPRAITLALTAEAASKVYGELDPTLAVSVSGLGLANGDAIGDVTGVMSRQAGEDVGDYLVSLGAAAKAGNYSITFNAADSTMRITPRDITVQADAAGKVYGGADPTLTLSVLNANADEGVAASDSLTDVVGTLTRQAGEDVGAYDVILGAGAKAGNYNISFDADNNAIVITPRNISVQATSASKIYGNADPALAVTYTNTAADEGVAAGDGLSDVVGTLSRQAGEDVGTYDVVLGSGTKAGNYNISFDTDNNALSITPRAITLALTAAAASKVYGEADPSLAVNVSGLGLANGDAIGEVTGVMTRQFGENVGDYLVSLGAAAKAGNYSITFDAADSTMHIAPRDISLVANASSKIYGNADPVLGVSVTNTAGDEGVAPRDSLASVVGVLSRQAGEDVGAYDLVLGAGSRAGNYNISFNADNNALSITPRAISLSLTAQAASKTYGEADPTLAVNVGGLGLANGDAIADVTGTMSRELGENVGDYLVRLGASAKAGNYSISFNAADSTMRILPRDLKLVADAVAKTYGELDPSLSVSVTNTATDEGVAPGDSLADILGVLSRQTGENVGKYNLVLSQGDKTQNYTITFDANNQAFAITPVAPNLTNDEANKEAALAATRQVIASVLPDGLQVGGMLMIPINVDAPQLLQTQDVKTVIAGAPTAQVEQAQAMGLLGMLVVDGGVAKPNVGEQ